LTNCRWLWGVLLFLCCLSVHATAPADISIISEITKASRLSEKPSSKSLPHFIDQSQSGLSEVAWTIHLPKTLSNAALPALLIPQPVQGAVYKIDNEIIYELKGSDSVTSRNWYQPILISIPRFLLSVEKDTHVSVIQTGHLRGWFIGPMFAGDLSALRPYFSYYAWISQTLYTTINFLSAIFGIFFLVIGLRSKSSAYFYSGMTTLTWSLLISVALISDIPSSGYLYWRMAIYATTGWLIYFVSMFTIVIFGHALPKKIRLCGLVYLNLGWMIYALTGPESEQWLDLVWTGFAVGIYAVSTGGVIYQALSKRQFALALPIAIHGLITSALAFHDYLLQSGSMPLSLTESHLSFWTSLVLQPIYLTHIALPVFVAMAMWLLIQDHKNKTYNELRHVTLMNEQRERIVNDIHDGVGSRINLLLWSLRTSSPKTDEIESDLQRCMEELRFAINPIQAGHETLHKALTELCQRLKLAAHQQGIELDYLRSGQPMTVASEIGLHLYKATQECLSNALRHSQATHISVVLNQNDQEISIEVQDDGTGIPDWDEATQSQQTQKSTSMGLLSLFQRLKNKGGQVHILSNREGTRVRLSITL
jgi:signal transduction histidine kinase